jgi:uncharacterized protein (TIGR02996 family)
MPDEDGFLTAIRANPDDKTARLVYADWLDDRADPRGDFIRLHLALRAAAPDHPERVAAEHELSALRVNCDPGWLAAVEPKRIPRTDDPTAGRGCDCVDRDYSEQLRKPVDLHTDTQDTECDPWKRLLDRVEQAAADGREEFAPLRGMGAEDRARILTLPATIAKLKAVKTFILSGSYLLRIPPEVGEMTALEEFDPYTSYRLHWFPYELTRCRNLRDSRVSTRAIYGNYKHRPMFPALDPGAEPERLPLKRWQGGLTRPCSVCGRTFEDRGRHRVWVSLWVATDVLPLLVNACSEGCITRLPTPAKGYVWTPHRGGPGVKQPPPRWW